MTQMGLDYQKHLENRRHNLVSESIDSRNAASNERNAASNESNAYSNARNAASNERNAYSQERTSFANERNAATNERNANINQQNADTNRMQAQTSQYIASFKPREVAASEGQANARLLSAQAAQTQAANSAEANQIKRESNALTSRSIDVEEAKNAITKAFNEGKLRNELIKMAGNKMSGYYARQGLGQGEAENLAQIFIDSMGEVLNSILEVF